MVSRESKIETMKDIHLIGGVFYDDILESEDEESSSTLEEVDSVFSEEAINVRVELCTEVLKALGEDVSREGIVKTPLVRIDFCSFFDLMSDVCLLVFNLKTEICQGIESIPDRLYEKCSEVHCHIEFHALLL